MRPKLRQIQETNNYTLFEQDDTNRDFRPNPDLKKSMETYGFLPEHPIVVVAGNSARFRIKDGGHRLSYAKLLGLSVFYVVSDNDALSIPDINKAARRWSLQDYISSFCRQGNENYKSLEVFSKTHGIDSGACAKILGNGELSAVKSGAFRVTKFEHARDVVAVCDAISRHAKWGRHHTAVASVHMVLSYSEVVLSVLLDRIATNPGKLRQPVNVQDGILMLEGIYNMRARDIVPVAAQVKQNLKAKRAIGRPNK